MLINCLLSVSLLVNSRLLVVQFWGDSKVTRAFWTVWGGVPNPQVVPGSPAHVNKQPTRTVT